MNLKTHLLLSGSLAGHVMTQPDIPMSGRIYPLTLNLWPNLSCNLQSWTYLCMSGRMLWPPMHIRPCMKMHGLTFLWMSGRTLIEQIAGSERTLSQLLSLINSSRLIQLNSSSSINLSRLIHSSSSPKSIFYINPTLPSPTEELTRTHIRANTKNRTERE